MVHPETPTSLRPHRPSASIFLPVGACLLLTASSLHAEELDPAAQPAPSGMPILASQAAPTPPMGGSQQAAPRGARPTPVRKPWRLFGSLRTRQEAWRWFETPGFQDTYTFNGTNLRLGVARETSRTDLLLELMGVGFVNLPNDAAAPPPRGPLGLGGLYFGASSDQDASAFVKQAFWRRKALGAPGNSLRIGRIEFIEGLERVPSEPSLAWLKRERIAHRLLGNFGWTHVGRSYDGGEFTRTVPGGTLTLFGGIPTRGVFDIEGMDTLPNVRVGYAAGTAPFATGSLQGEGRLFGIYYNDARDVVKTDNRPLPVRQSDFKEIRLGTVGGHAIGVWNTPAGPVDMLLWGAGQFGSWGPLSHGAYAVAAEAGFQPRGVAGKPWLRAGFFRASGDGNPSDRKHGTLIPLLTTARIYARFPFFTYANVNDAYGQVIFRPSPKLTLRADGHVLSLANRNDLWYQGGGAFQDRPAFGYVGRPSNGQSGLATLGDISVDYQARKNTTLSLYFGYAAGGDVVRSSFAGDQGMFGYFEIMQRF